MERVFDTDWRNYGDFGSQREVALLHRVKGRSNVFFEGERSGRHLCVLATDVRR